MVFIRHLSSDGWQYMLDVTLASEDGDMPRLSGRHSPGCVTCIATLPWNALLPLSVSIEFVSSSARVTSVKSTKGLGLS